MACKESMVVAPLVVVLFEAIFVFGSIGTAMSQRWKFYFCLAATWIVLAVLIWTGPRANSAGFSTSVGPWSYLLNQPRMIARYLWLSIWPSGLVLDYGITRPTSLSAEWPYVVAVGALVIGALVSVRLRPVVGFLAVSFFVLLAPTSSVVPIATEVGAERRMYLPLASVVIGAVLGGRQVIDRLAPAAARRRYAIAIVALVCALETAVTWHRNSEYSSALTMAQITVARRPHGRTHGFLAEELLAAGHRDEAIAEFRAGAADYPLARFALGQELFVDRKLDDSIRELRRFIEEAPRLVEVPHARELIGRALFQQRDWKDAEREFRTILQIAPTYSQAHLRLADALNNEERLEEAAAEYRLFLRAEPGDYDALSRLGSALSRSGHHEEAVQALTSAAQIRPDNPIAHANLANALLNKRDSPAAEREARRAIELNAQDSVGYELLGLSLAAQGRVNEAREYFDAAIKLDPDSASAREYLARLK
jgi:Flp pilus assembly protein TadD